MGKPDNIFASPPDNTSGEINKVEEINLPKTEKSINIDNPEIETGSKIRKLEKSDSSQVALLIKQLTPRIANPENILDRIERLAESENSCYVVVETEGKIVGFGGLAWYVIPSKGLIGWIEEVVVDENYRRKGIGRKIMEELMKLAQEKQLTQVKLTTANPTAKHLYEKLGFVDKGEDLLVKKNY